MKSKMNIKAILLIFTITGALYSADWNTNEPIKSKIIDSYSDYKAYWITQTRAIILKNFSQADSKMIELDKNLTDALNNNLRVARFISYSRNATSVDWIDANGYGMTVQTVEVYPGDSYWLITGTVN